MPNYTKVMVQFSFSKEKHIPPGLEERPKETHQDHIERKIPVKDSVCLIKTNTERAVDVTSIRGKLEASGFILVNASSQERVKPNDTWLPTYYTVRFVFYRSDMPRATICQPAAHVALDLISTMAFWHIRAYANRSDEADDLLSINCEARVQRFTGENPKTPILSRTNGSKPRRANNTLEFVNGLPTLVPYQI